MNKCDFTECDKRYVMRIWLYGTAVVACLGIVGLCFAAGSWKTETDNKVRSAIETSIETSKKVDMLENRLLPKVDSLLQWTRKQ